MILTGAKFATMTGDSPYGLIENGALVIEGSRIAWVGPKADLPANYANRKQIDLGGRLVTPGLTDCHTHLVFAGDRVREFEMRLNGASYEDIAKAGGGIVSTVRATRAADLDTLIKDALVRVDAFIAGGVTAVEIKSGYGLDQQSELNMLRAARAIGQRRAITVRTTFLGAHAVPAEYKGQADRYIDEVCIPALRAAHAEGLVDAVDGFCEGIAFQPGQIERVFRAARELGLPVKLHAGQLSSLGGARLAARYGALSADHLEYANDEDALASEP